MIYAHRFVDIITEDTVPIEPKSDVKAQFEEILRTIPTSAKNSPTLER